MKSIGLTKKGLIVCEGLEAIGYFEQLKKDRIEADNESNQD